MKSCSSTARGIGAFFDLDGTLIPPPSLEHRFFVGLQRTGAIPLSNYVRWIIHAARLLPKGINAVMLSNKHYLHGLSCKQAIQQTRIATFYEEGVTRLAWHARQGHQIVIVSGTLEPLAKIAATTLDCELEAIGEDSKCIVCSTKLEEKAGRWTGRVIGEAMHGDAKARAIRRIADATHLDLSESYAYGNSLEDRQMLSAVGLGQAVNPGEELAKLAKFHGWPIRHWDQNSEFLPESNCRAQSVIRKAESDA